MLRNIEYKYHVRRVPFINYVSKQVEALISPEQVISNVGTHTAPQRLLKKRYSVRIEFEQAGSLGNGRLVYFAVYCYYYEQSSLLNF